VNRIGGGAERDAIVRTIVDLGGHLGLDTIAEGVERADQVVALAGMGCHLIQGFLFAPAMPATDFAEYVRFREAAAKSL
jgi:EAL domain-containing protein (putative c-di-GMP-specific phosphodiesterase class I)